MVSLLEETGYSANAEGTVDAVEVSCTMYRQSASVRNTARYHRPGYTTVIRGILMFKLFAVDSHRRHEGISKALLGRTCYWLC